VGRTRVRIRPREILGPQGRPCGQVPNTVLPAQRPRSFQKVIDLFGETGAILKTASDNRTVVRDKVWKLSRAPVQSRLERTRPLGTGLVEPKDEQTVLAAISWSDIIQGWDGLLRAGRQSFVKEVERDLEPRS